MRLDRKINNFYRIKFFETYKKTTMPFTFVYPIYTDALSKLRESAEISVDRYTNLNGIVLRRADVELIIKIIAMFCKNLNFRFLRALNPRQKPEIFLLLSLAHLNLHTAITCFPPLVPSPPLRYRIPLSPLLACLYMYCTYSDSLLTKTQPL